VRRQAPLRGTLALSRASAASRSQTLALLGLFQTATHANHLVQLPCAHDDVISLPVTSWVIWSQHSTASGSIPLAPAQPKFPLWNVLFISGAKALIYLHPRSPPDGVSASIWWALQPHGGQSWSSPHVYRFKWYLSVGHGPAHQKLCPPWAHQSQGS